VQNAQNQIRVFDLNRRFDLNGLAGPHNSMREELMGYRAPNYSIRKARSTETKLQQLLELYNHRPFGFS